MFSLMARALPLDVRIGNRLHVSSRPEDKTCDHLAVFQDDAFITTELCDDSFLLADEFADGAYLMLKIRDNHSVPEDAAANGIELLIRHQKTDEHQNQ